MVEYRALGALDVVVGGDRADLGGPRQRRLLAALLVHRGSVVSTDALVDAVFAGDPTPRAAATLRSYVTRLRRAIGPSGADALHRDGSGYRLSVVDDGFDVARFEALATRGRRELVYGDAAAAVTTARQALGLWRGRAYEEFADEPWVQPEARRLEELRLIVTEHLVDAELECGRAAEMVAELEHLVDAEPFREVFRSRLMLALYRSGRASDALAAYQEHRRRLADELGLDPSPELADLQRRILAHDPSLRQTEPSGRPLRGYRLGERLGRGRLGVVHAARLVGATRDLVIRLYPAETADDPVFVRRFEADARRLAALDHPGVVTVLDAWREPGAAALVMRRMTGGTLRDRLDAGAALSRVDAVSVELRLLPHREMTVGELRLAVHPPRVVVVAHVGVVRIDRPPRVLGGRAHRHDPRPGRADHQRQEVADERPVAEMVDAELGVEAVLGGPLGHRHHAGVAQQDVEPVVPRLDGLGGRCDRRERREVELHDLERGVRVLGQDRLPCSLGLLLVPGSHDDVRAGAGERLCGRQAEPAVRAGHDRDAAGLVGDVVDGPGHGHLAVRVSRRYGRSGAAAPAGHGRPPSS